jgi:hypothetical protein
MKQADTWLKFCLLKHDCNRRLRGNRGAFNPTRLIDVGERNTSTGTPWPEPRLHVSGESTTRLYYLTLSHCWGAPPHPCQLTTANINNLQRRIKYDALPATFQDVIKLARRFSMRYIWIDALCIV